jgi:hypothetical protein
LARDFLRAPVKEDAGSAVIAAAIEVLQHVEDFVGIAVAKAGRETWSKLQNA